MVRTGQLNLHQASALAKLEKVKAQVELAEIAAADNLPGDALRNIVESIRTGEKVEAAVVSSTRRRAAEKPEPAASKKPAVPPVVENSLEPAEERTTGMSMHHRGIMKELSEQQFEDLAYQVDAHKLNVPETRVSAAIMEDNPSWDVVISDYMLPGMDGGTFLKKAKEIQPKLKTILITSYDPHDIDTVLKENDIDHFIAKPVSIDSLHYALASTNST